MPLESKKLRVIFGWNVFIFAAFCGNLEAQQNSPPSQEQAAKIAEIEDLRKKIGGGVAESLGELLDPKVAQQEFALELERLSSESGPSLQAKTNGDLPKRLRIAPARPSQANPRLFSPRLLKDSPRPKPSGRLLYQSIARKLDGITADLEEASYYEEADSMRELAESYWQKARKMQPVPRKSELRVLPLGALEEKK